MKTYAIAAYLTEEEKDLILSKKYRWNGHSRVCADGKCPLGVIMEFTCMPDDIDIANLFFPEAQRWEDSDWEGARKAACDFINAWDGKEIPPSKLAQALGR
jgi:hypothetical protein